MIITIDTDKLTDLGRETLAEHFAQRAAECEHLSGAVPIEHEDGMIRNAETHRATAERLRNEIKLRRSELLERFEAIKAKRRAADKPVPDPEDYRPEDRQAYT